MDIVDDSCPSLPPLNAAEQAQYRDIIATLANLIENEDEMNYLLPPAFCTRFQKAARAQKPRYKSDRTSPYEAGGGLNGERIVGGGKWEKDLSDEQRRAIRYLAWVLAICFIAGASYAVYSSGVVSWVLRWLVSNTWLGGQLNGVAAIFENLLVGCDKLGGVATRWTTMKAAEGALGQMGSYVDVEAAKPVVGFATMSCGQTITVIEKVLLNTQAAVLEYQKKIGAASVGFGVAGWAFAGNEKSSEGIKKFIDIFEAILYKLLAGLEVSTLSAHSVFEYLIRKKDTEVAEVAEAAVRATPGALERPGAGAGYSPGPGGKKTNKRRKQSKRKPKRKPKKTAKRRRRSKK
jgi:hypothetical protein